MFFHVLRITLAILGVFLTHQLWRQVKLTLFDYVLWVHQHHTKVSAPKQSQQ